MFKRLHELGTFLNVTHSDAMLCYASYPDRVYTIEHSILTLLERVSMRPCSPVGIGVMKTFLIAGLLYIYTNLRQTPVGHGMRRRLATRIKKCHEQNPESHSLMATEMLAETLWTMLLAGTVTSQQRLLHSDNQWFASLIKKICLGNCLRTWNEVETFCACMPVLEASFASSYKEYWQSCLA